MFKKQKYKNRIYVAALLVFLSGLQYLNTLPPASKIDKNENENNIFKVFYINSTPSIPCGVYLKIPAFWLRQGDTVVYKPQKECIDTAIACGWLDNDDKNILFVKHIGGLEGDIFEVDFEKNFYINGKFYGQILTQDGTGQPIPSLKTGKNYVAADMFLPVGDNPRSFDGRYTGQVPLENIHAKVIPLLTEDMIP